MTAIATSSLLRPTLLAVILIPAFGMMKAQTLSGEKTEPSCSSRRGQTFLSDDKAYCLVKATIPKLPMESFRSWSERWMRQDERSKIVAKLMQVRIIARGLRWERNDLSPFTKMRTIIDDLCSASACAKAKHESGLNESMGADDLLDRIVDVADKAIHSENQTNIIDARYSGDIKEMWDATSQLSKSF